MSQAGEPLVVETHSPEETQEWARVWAGQLKPGAIIALDGDLGAGKTCFVTGLAAGLGCRGAVSSPTFGLVHEYDGPVPLVHFDFYRIVHERELFEMGWQEYVDSGAILVIEWAARFPDLIPPGSTWLHLEEIDAQSRRITLSYQTQTS